MSGLQEVHKNNIDLIKDCYIKLRSLKGQRRWRQTSGFTIIEQSQRRISGTFQNCKNSSVNSGLEPTFDGKKHKEW